MIFHNRRGHLRTQKASKLLAAGVPRPPSQWRGNSLPLPKTPPRSQHFQFRVLTLRASQLRAPNLLLNQGPADDDKYFLRTCYPVVNVTRAQLLQCVWYANRCSLVTICKHKYHLRKHYFTNRVYPVWNSLPNNVVTAENINIFKNRLGKFWSSYPIQSNPMSITEAGQGLYFRLFLKFKIQKHK